MRTAKRLSTDDPGLPPWRKNLGIVLSGYWRGCRQRWMCFGIWRGRIGSCQRCLEAPRDEGWGREVLRVKKKQQRRDVSMNRSEVCEKGRERDARQDD